MRIRKTQVLIVTDSLINDNKSGQFNSKTAREITGNDFNILGFLYQKDIFEEMIKADLNDNEMHLDSEKLIQSEINNKNIKSLKNNIELKEVLIQN